MENYADLTRRLNRDAVANLNAMRDRLEALSAMGGGSAPNEEMTPRHPERVRAFARVTGRDDLSTGSLPAYTVQILWMIDTSQANLLSPYTPPILRPVMFVDQPANNTSTASVPAYEISGNYAVPIDGAAVVEIWPGPGPCYFFVYNPWLRVVLLGDEDPDTPGSYDWLEQYPGANGTFHAAPNGLSGTYSANPATELNNVTGLSDTYQIIYRAYTSGAPQVIIGYKTDGDGVATNSQQTLILPTNALGGTFTLTFNTADTNQNEQANEQTTAALNYNASASDIASALEALTNVSFAINVTGSGVATDPYLITFDDPGFANFPLLRADSTLLQNDQEWLFSAGSAAYDDDKNIKLIPESYGETDVSPGYYKAELYDRNQQPLGIEVRVYDENDETLEPGLFYRAWITDYTIDGMTTYYTNVFAGGGDCGAGCPGWEGAFTDITTGPYLADPSFDSAACALSATGKYLHSHLPAGSTMVLDTSP